MPQKYSAGTRTPSLFSMSQPAFRQRQKKRRYASNMFFPSFRLSAVPDLCVCFPHMAVKSAAFQQFAMCPDIQNTPMLNDRDLIRACDGTETVCNHNQRFPLCQPADCLLKHCLVFRVCVGSRLVQNHNRGVFIMARAMDTRWRSPPDRWPPAPPTIVS